jgi:hypothetical protein
MSPSPSKNFLIVGSEVLIAQDIEMTIRRLWPDAMVLFERNIQDAESWLESVENLLYAFIATGPENGSAASIHSKIAERGGRLVMLGRECPTKQALGAFAVSSAMLFLPYPFTEEHLLKLFRAEFIAPET